MPRSFINAQSAMKEKRRKHNGMKTTQPGSRPSKCLTAPDPDHFCVGLIYNGRVRETYSVMTIVTNTVMTTGNLLGVKFRYSHHTHLNSNCEMIC